MPKRSAGLLMYRRRPEGLEVFLVHPGGPLWRRKDLGSWSIPKGQYLDGEDPLAAAKREFIEETGFPAGSELVDLGGAKQPSGKIVKVWAFEGDCDPAELKSNTFSLEWPPDSGRTIEAPEVDRGAWFDLKEARLRILKGQIPFLDRILERIDTIV